MIKDQTKLRQKPLSDTIGSDVDRSTEDIEAARQRICDVVTTGDVKPSNVQERVGTEVSRTLTVNSVVTDNLVKLQSDMQLDQVFKNRIAELTDAGNTAEAARVMKLRAENLRLEGTLRDDRLSRSFAIGAGVSGIGFCIAGVISWWLVFPGFDPNLEPIR